MHPPQPELCTMLNMRLQDWIWLFSSLELSLLSRWYVWQCDKNLQNHKLCWKHKVRQIVSGILLWVYNNELYWDLLQTFINCVLLNLKITFHAIHYIIVFFSDFGPIQHTNEFQIGWLSQGKNMKYLKFVLRHWYNFIRWNYTKKANHE